MRRRPLLLLVLALLTLGSGTVAAKPFVTTDAVHQTYVVEHLLAFQHCRPELGLYTRTVDFQMRWHVTAAGVDDSDPGEPGQLIPPYHLTYTTTATIDLVPETTGEPVFTGHGVTRQVEHDLAPGPGHRVDGPNGPAWVRRVEGDELVALPPDGDPAGRGGRELRGE